MHIISIVIYYFLAFVGLVLTPFAVPGTYVILGASIFFSIIYKFDPFPWYILLIFLVLTVAGEVVEFFLGVFTVKKYGGSKWGMIGTFVGGILGALIGSAILPVLGTAIGVFVGAIVLAIIAEYIYTQKEDVSMKAGWGAFVGRVGALTFKYMCISAMVIISVFYVR
ncbi:DUF456 domain-containing protein [bacterium]|nr:DUF456 domain-containing protein [bacterium]